MKMTKKLRTSATCSMIACLLFFGIQTPAMANMVTTQELAMQAELQLQRDDVRNFIARDDVRDALTNYGVNPADIDARIDNLTTSELLQIQNQLSTLPAGGSGVLAVVLGLIIIFVLLDLLGATDVFPRV
jgi:hypothetical protein